MLKGVNEVVTNFALGRIGALGATTLAPSVKREANRMKIVKNNGKHAVGKRRFREDYTLVLPKFYRVAAALPLVFGGGINEESSGAACVITMQP